MNIKRIFRCTAHHAWNWGLIYAAVVNASISKVVRDVKSPDCICGTGIDIFRFDYQA